MNVTYLSLFVAVLACAGVPAAASDVPLAQPAENIPGPAAPMPGELPELLLLRGQVGVEVVSVAAGEEVYLTLDDPAAGPMQILVQLEGQWPGETRTYAIADGRVKARKDEGVAVVDKASGETLLFWLTEPFRDAGSTAPGVGDVTPIQAYGWSAFWGYETTQASGVLPEIDKCPDNFTCLAGGDPEADSCSIGGCSEPPTQCSVGGCVGQYCACCGCEPFACCRCIRACGG